MGATAACTWATRYQRPPGGVMVTLQAQPAAWLTLKSGGPAAQHAWHPTHKPLSKVPTCVLCPRS